MKTLAYLLQAHRINKSQFTDNNIFLDSSEVRIFLCEQLRSVHSTEASLIQEESFRFLALNFFNSFLIF